MRTRSPKGSSAAPAAATAAGSRSMPRSSRSGRAVEERPGVATATRPSCRRPSRPAPRPGARSPPPPSPAGGGSRHAIPHDLLPVRRSRLPGTATSPPDASTKAKRAEGALAPRRPGGWWRARRLAAVNVLLAGCSPCASQIPKSGRSSDSVSAARAHPVELLPAVAVPDLDPGVDARDHDLALEVGELAQVAPGSATRPCLSGWISLGAAEEDARGVELLRPPLRLLPDLARHLLELLRREHRETAALALGDERRPRRAGPGTSPGGSPAPWRPGSAGTLPGTSGIPRLSSSSTTSGPRAGR